MMSTKRVTNSSHIFQYGLLLFLLLLLAVEEEVVVVVLLFRYLE